MSARLFALAAGAAMLIGAAVVPATANAGCRGTVQADAQGTFKYPTELLSRAYWRSEVRERYGSGYAFWSNAEDKSTRCFKKEPGDKWHCVSRGRACD